MMRPPLELRPEALLDAEEARRWYARRSTVAADKFLDELDNALEAIQESPERWPQYTHRTRRYLVKRFPYLIVYRVLPDRISVIAIAHARRRPGFWKSRLKDHG